jgi:hypothetical protein
MVTSPGEPVDNAHPDDDHGASPADQGNGGTDPRRDDPVDPTNPDSDPDGINPSDPHPAGDTNPPDDEGEESADS